MRFSCYTQVTREENHNKSLNKKWQNIHRFYNLVDINSDLTISLNKFSYNEFTDLCLILHIDNEDL